MVGMTMAEERAPMWMKVGEGGQILVVTPWSTYGLHGECMMAAEWGRQ